MVGQKIKKYLNEHGITQTWLSTRTGIRLQALNASLNGIRALSLEEYERIIGALELTAGTFLEPKAPEVAANGKA